MENSSGQGPLSVVPEEIKGLCFGGFLLSFIWGICNRVWISLLTFVPCIGCIMPFVLLFKGREWAWRARRWESIEHFNSVQKKWTVAGLVVLIAVFILGIAAAIAIPAFISARNRAEISAHPAPLEYLGKWEGADGSTISISSDGNGEFKGGNTSVSGGAVTFDAATRMLSIKLLGIGKTWTVEESPHETDGIMEMKLDDMVYRRTAGFTPREASSGESKVENISTNIDSGISMPSENELTALVDSTMVSFKDGVEHKDFSTLYSGASDPLKSQVTLEKFTSSFQSFLDQSIDLSAIDDVYPSFTDEPKLDNDHVMHLTGDFTGKKNTVHFVLGYVHDSTDKWRLISIKVHCSGM